MKNKPELGNGIFTVPEASIILDIPSYKINRWLSKYWEMDFQDKNVYTWGRDKDRGFNFYTLMELIAVYSFRTVGLSFFKIKEAHKILGNILKTHYPFATSRLLTDGKNILWDSKKDLMILTKKKQYVFKAIIEPYCKNIDFNDQTYLAKRYWPLGKKHSIVVDPHHGFGQPTIQGTNISVFSLIQYIESGESMNSISKLFNIKLKEVRDVVLFNDRIAA